MLSLDAAGALRARVLRPRTGSTRATCWSRTIPYHGGGHLPDYNVFAPVVVDGELRADRVDPVPPRRHRRRHAGRLQRRRARHLGRGRALPGGEALRPRRRAARRRRTCSQVNNRTPTFLGDLRAQVGAAQLGARRLAGDRRALRRRRGARRVPSTRSSTPSGASARRWRAGPTASTRPTPTSTTTRSGNQDIHVHCAVTVDGDRLTVDFTGSDTRPELQAYSTFGNTRGYVVAQLASMMDPDDPEERGLLRLDRADRARGLLPEPAAGQARWPRARTIPGVEVGEAICKALAQVCPSARCPQIYKLGMPTRDLRHAPRDRRSCSSTTRVDALAAYCGAVKGQDGWGAMQRVVRQPDPRHRRDQRVDLPGAPRVPRLRDRHAAAPASGAAARARAIVKQVLAPATRLHLHGRHEVPDAGHRGRPATARPNRAHAARRQPARASEIARHGRRACRTRAGEALRVPLRRRRRLGRSARARSRDGARRRARRVRVARGRAARLRRRAHGQRSKTTRSRSTTTRNARSCASASAKRARTSARDELPHRHRRRRHVHRLRPALPDGGDRARQGADHARRPEPTA